MPLKVYNTLTQAKEEFQPLDPPRVNMYVCGITVYDYCHLGHARAAVVFDVIYRYLKHLGYEVRYVRNFTDIDDKIIKRSNESGEDWKVLTQRFIEAFHEDMGALGNHAPTDEPKATDYIQKMQEMIATLVDQGLAYPAGGDVFYAVRKFSNYGKLANKNIEDLAVGARVEVQEEKKDPLDFALWKAAKPGEPHWPSPWGDGRPGWHIECSTMSTQLLGPTLDIHGGGRDLAFPHHENELAQSEGATEKPFVRYWLHNGFVNLNADKMSKSTGNFLTIREILKKYSFDSIRYFLLSSHYRSPIDFTDQNMQEAGAAVDRVYETLSRLQNYVPGPTGLQGFAEEEDLAKLLKGFSTGLSQAMDDDFNTALALGRVFDLVRVVNKYLDQKPSQESWKQYQKEIQRDFNRVSEILGLFGQSPEKYFAFQKNLVLQKATLGSEEIEEKIQQRKAARAAKDFNMADQIRDELADLGIILKDNPDGTTTWSVK